MIDIKKIKYKDEGEYINSEEYNVLIDIIFELQKQNNNLLKNNYSRYLNKYFRYSTNLLEKAIQVGDHPYKEEDVSMIFKEVINDF